MADIRRTSTRPTLVLAVLFAGAFVMGCAEMLVVGLIDLIAIDLSVSVPAAGGAVPPEGGLTSRRNDVVRLEVLEALELDLPLEVGRDP